jgi:hypothetical protein
MARQASSGGSGRAGGEDLESDVVGSGGEVGVDAALYG